LARRDCSGANLSGSTNADRAADPSGSTDADCAANGAANGAANADRAANDNTRADDNCFPVWHTHRSTSSSTITYFNTYWNTACVVATFLSMASQAVER
jgi:hypothetical protein